MKKRVPDSTFTDIDARIIPKSSRNEITALEQGIVKIRVTAPPVDGLANRAVIELISKKFKIPKKNIEIISGDKSKNKRIRVHGISCLDF
ncbi:MAG: YggU family protein [Deltaproteobacteria bacterium]|nr:YggU family protein [Deltaproteobacteria bacterium]